MKQRTPFTEYNLGAEPEEKCFFEITSLTNLKERAGDWPSPFPHRHTFYEILFVFKGKGRHFIDFKPYSLTNNSLYFITPKQVHLWQIETLPEGYAILFTEDFLLLSPSNKNIIHELSYFHTVDMPLELQLKDKQIDEVMGNIQSVKKEYNTCSFGRSSMLQAYMLILLIQIQRIYNKTHTHRHSSQTSSLVKRFRRLVSEKFAQEKKLHFYADTLNVSTGHLSNTVKAITNYSPSVIIRQEVILNAKRLLSHTNMTVAEIAYTLNYEDPSYFGRFFKRETQLSPVEFRCIIRKSAIIHENSPF